MNTPPLRKMRLLSVTILAFAVAEAGAATLSQWTLSYPSSYGNVLSVTSSGANSTTLTPTGLAPVGGNFTDTTGTYAGTDFPATASGQNLASSGVVPYLNFGANTEFTIETWVFAESISSGGRTIFSTRDTATGNPGFSLLQRGTAAGTGAGELSFVMDLGASSVSMNSTGTTMATNEWHHIAATRDTGGTFRLYLDGTGVAGTSAGNTGSITSTGATYIGRPGNSAAIDFHWDGGINVIRVSDAALTSGDFISLQTAIPEPGQYAMGLGVVALLFCGHLRRRR